VTESHSLDYKFLTVCKDIAALSKQTPQEEMPMPVPMLMVEGNVAAQADVR
jgi:hypothetical protein